MISIATVIFFYFGSAVILALAVAVFPAQIIQLIIGVLQVLQVFAILIASICNSYCKYLHCFFFCIHHGKANKKFKKRKKSAGFVSGIGFYCYTHLITQRDSIYGLPLRGNKPQKVNRGSMLCPDDGSCLDGRYMSVLVRQIEYG